MIEVISNYFLFLLCFQPIEEYYHCTHPSLGSENLHIVCNWKEEDFIITEKRITLKKSNPNDNKIKEHFRKRYHRLRNL